MQSSEPATIPADVASGSWQQFRTGFVDTMVLWLGVMPFGLAYALSAQAAGLTDLQTVAMSMFVFAGASQLTAAGLFATGAPGLSIIAATFVINLRHILLTATLAPALRKLSLPHRLALAFGVTDELFAISVKRITEHRAGPALLWGSNISLYISWQFSTIAGLLLGGVIPDATTLGLSLVFPLSFLVLLLPYLKSKPAWTAAVVAGAAALGARLLIPGSWYLVIGALAGSIAGAALERSATPRSNEHDASLQ